MQLLKAAYKFGELNKRGTTYRSWSKYFIIYAGSYLYLFNSKTDTNAATYIYVKDTVLSSAPDSDKEFSFKLTSKKGE